MIDRRAPAEAPRRSAPHSPRPSAIITGGSSGIGKALARRLAERGWTVSLIARRTDVLEAARAEVAAVGANMGAQVHIFAADVSKREGASAAVQRAIEVAGPPELVVASAGIAVPGYFDQLAVEVHEQTLAINYLGTLYTILAAWPAMRDAGRGSIVLLSSGAGLTGLFGYTAYAPSKFALRGLAESLRPEARRHGVHIAIVYPPDTDTPQLAAEDLIKPIETRAIAGSARVLSAEQVADEILRGVERKRFDIAPGIEMRLLNRLHSVFGPLLWRVFDHLADRARPRDVTSRGSSP